MDLNIFSSGFPLSYVDILIILCIGTALALIIPRLLSFPIIIPFFLILGTLPFLLAYLQMTIGLVWKTTILDNSLFVPCTDLKRYAYCQKIPSASYELPNAFIKTIKIKENGNYLPLQNAEDLKIARLGRGRYLVLNDSFIMSSTDNSDPRVNGKTYQIVQPATISIEILWLLGILALYTVYLLRSALPLKILIPFCLFFMFIAAEPILSKALWFALTIVNLLAAFYLRKDIGPKTLNRGQMLGFLALCGIVLYGFLEIR